MKKIIFSVVAILLCYSGFSQNKDILLKNYLAVKDALVNSDSKTSSSAIATFYRDIKKDSDFEQKSELIKAAEKLNMAKDLDKQREAFMKVSTQVWNVIKQGEKGSKQVYYQYCPMKKAYWLSTESEIRNPYYGDAMLSCGKVAEKLNK